MKREKPPTAGVALETMAGTEAQQISTIIGALGGIVSCSTNPISCLVEASLHETARVQIRSLGDSQRQARDHPVALWCTT